MGAAGEMPPSDHPIYKSTPTQGAANISPETNAPAKPEELAQSLRLLEYRTKELERKAGVIPKGEIDG